MIFKKYRHFKQREFKGNWISEIETDTGYKLKFKGKIYLPALVEDIKISLSDKALNHVGVFFLKNNPNLIADYVRDHWVRSFLYMIESLSDRKFK